MRADERTSGPVLKWLIHGHVWLALAVATQVLYTGLFLHPGTPVARYAAAAAIGAFTAYGMIRLARSKSASEKEHGTLGWFRSHWPLMSVMVAVGVLAAVLLLWPMIAEMWRWLVPVLAIALLYVTPFSTNTGEALGLRSIPFLKVLLIASIWAVVTVAVPWRLDLQEHDTFLIIAMACMRVPLFLGLAIIFDIRDLGNDAPGLRTVPIVFGVKGAKALSVLLLLISATFEWIFLQGLGYNVASYTILAGYVVAMLLAIRANPGDKRLTFDLLVDGMMILIPVCAWVGMKLG